MKNRIRILATSDIHGCIFPRHDTDGTEANHGIARVKTLIDALKDENTILVDNGDTLQGSAIQSYHYSLHPEEPSPMTRAMAELGYDYINLGNHDFDYGPDALAHHLSTLSAPCITSNVSYRGEPLGVSYVIREVAGKKLALFGVTTHGQSPAYVKGQRKHFKFRNAFESAKKTVETIRRLEKADYIIGLYHGGFERDVTTGVLNEEETGENQAYRMIREIDGLDVLITGHTHTELSGSAFNTTYAQPASNGESIICIDIYTDTGVIESRILKNDAPADDSILELLKQEAQDCETWLDTSLGHTSMDLLISDPFTARFRKSQAVTFLNRVMLEASGADIAAVSLPSEATGFHPEITMRDLFHTCPFDNTLVVKQLSGKDLRAYLEQTADYWAIDVETVIVNPSYLSPKARPYYYDMADGIEYTIKVSEDPGNRIVELTRNGVPIEDDDTFTICVSSYRASGGGNYDMIRSAPTVKVIPESMRELVRKAITASGYISFPPSENIIVKR
ncbi:MAG: bifunctional metallophosphatase/5'-nucleotidase [Solobacterium sp.]|nr:bifunctional metallophosphatase/5'-nucleotidase [Solobacterium sp.]